MNTEVPGHVCTGKTEEECPEILSVIVSNLEFTLLFFSMFFHENRDELKKKSKQFWVFQ